MITNRCNAQQIKRVSEVSFNSKIFFLLVSVSIQLNV